MEIFYNLSMFWSLFHVEVLFLLLFQPRYSKRITLSLSFAVPVVLIFLNLILISQLGFEAFMNLALLTCTIPTLVLGFVLSRYHDGRFFFTFCMADTTSFWIMQVTNLLDRMCGDTYIVMFLSRIVLFLLLEAIIWFYLRRPYLVLQAETKNGWWLFTAVAAVYYILIVTMSIPVGTALPAPPEILKLLFVMLLMPLTYFTIFSALYRQLLLFRAQANDRVLAAQREQLEAQLENQQAIRRIQHDLKSFKNTLSGLLAEGKLEEARVFLQEIGDFNVRAETDYCSDPYVNAVLGHFVSRFKEAGAALHIDVKLGTETLPYMELCLILSNALENSLDAVLSLSGDEREASVQLRRKGVYLLLRIKNRCDTSLQVEKGIFPKTTKKESGHGYGLYTIHSTAERLDGNATCYTENGWFFTDVMIKHECNMS